jgi:apolipoprotein N-acyltransferase
VTTASPKDDAAAREPTRALPLIGAPGLVAGLSGVWAGVLSFGLGVMGSFGQAPFHLWPLTLAMLTAFVWQLDGAAAMKRPKLAGFWRGWCLGFGYFLAGLWWVSSAFLVDADRYAALIPLAVTTLPAGLALFWGAIGALAVWLWRRDGRRVLLLATVFFAVEFLRGHVLTGFPWNLAGQVWPAGGAISQAASVVGVYGLTLATLFAFMAPAALLAPSKRITTSVTPTLIVLPAFVMLFAVGHARLAAASTELAPDVHLRIVQADIDQAEKWRPENLEAVRDHYLRLSSQTGVETRTHIVWAESALPIRYANVDLTKDAETLGAIARVLGDGRVLLTGYIRTDVRDGRAHYFNAFGVFAVEGGNTLLRSYYDKVKLVPFGEYTPFLRLARRIAPDALVSFSDGYTPGVAAAPVTAPGAPPLSPQICYEVVFPRFTPRGSERPGWIVNVTNDSWYKGTPGPFQLYNQARYRAIEEGLPLARAASGGISALVDPFGRSIAALPAEADDVIDADLPAALRPPLYALWGDVPILILTVVGFLIAAIRRRRRP